MYKSTPIIWVMLTLLITCSCKNQHITAIEGENAFIDRAEKISISQTLRENDHLEIKEQVALYHQLKKESPNKYNFENEDELTMYGYSFLWSNKVAEATEIFKLIVTQFPNSSNPYDSLGEAYLVAEDYEKSLINYKKSLAMNPDNFNAEDQIERIEFPNRKQETPQERFVKTYTVEQYKEDLDELGEKLIEFHPNIFKFITKEKFLQIIEDKKVLIREETTYGNFIWHCSEVIASINCSHTSLSSFYQESEMLGKSLVFPIQTRWVNNRLLVVDQMNNDGVVALKDEITSINGKVVSEIVYDSYKHIQSQGEVESAKTHFFNSWSTEMIPYALGFPVSYTVEIKGKSDPVVLQKATSFRAPYKDTSIERCKDDLCLSFVEQSNTAVLTISTFNYYPWNNLEVFKNFIADSFKKINEKGSKNLVIDVRFNGGGSAESSIYLLRHLIDRPFVYFSEKENQKEKEHQPIIENHFKGRLFFMIDGNGKSTTGHFMAMAKHLNLGTSIGEELGSNQFCTAGQTICRLKNTKIEFNVANTTSRLAATILTDKKGVLPDHYVVQNIDDYMNNIDTVKEFTLELIQK